MGFCGVYPLVNVNRKLWNIFDIITMLNEKIHYFPWAMFNSYVTVITRGYLGFQPSSCDGCMITDQLKWMFLKS